MGSLDITWSISYLMHYVWNDGYASQFKGVKNWFDVAKSLGLIGCPKFPFGCMMQWNYWGTSHKRAHMMV